MSSGNVWKAFKENMREHWPGRIIALVVVAVVIISLFGLAFEKGPTQNISVDVVDLDMAGTNSTAASITAMMGTGTTVNIIHTYTSADADPLQAALDDLESGEVEAVIFFGQNFSHDIVAWISATTNGSTVAPSSLTLYLDSANPIASSAVQGEVQRCTQTVLVSQYHLSLPVRLVANVVYGEGVDMRDFMAPAIAGLLIFILTLMPSLMSSMSGSNGPLTKYSVGEAMIARSMTSLVIGAVLATTILVVLAAFGINMTGDIAAAFVLLMLLAVASAGLGLLLASVTKKAPGATMAIFPLVLYPAILLGGIILPISSIPGYLLPVSYLFPLTYAIDGTRLVLLDGFGWEHVWIQTVALIAYAIICMAIAWYIEVRTGRETN